MDYQTLAAMLIRNATVTAAGALIAHGYAPNGTTEEQLAGGFMILFSIAWSWWQKAGQAKAIATWERIAVDAAHSPAQQPVITPEKLLAQDAAKQAIKAKEQVK